MKLKSIAVAILCLLPCFSQRTEAQSAKKDNVKKESRSYTLGGSHFHIGLASGFIHQRGVGIELFANAAQNTEGLQFSGLFNVSETIRGVQITPFVNIAENLHGLQTGLVNITQRAGGLQAGLLNIAQEGCGVQLGFLNINDDSQIVSIAPFTISSGSTLETVTYAGSVTNIGNAFRITRGHNYMMLGLGIGYHDLHHNFSFGLDYRRGLIFPLGRKIALTTSAGLSHIETCSNHNAHIIPRRMFSMQLRAGVEIKLKERLGLSIDGGYVWTRHYNRDLYYRKAPLAEIGIVRYINMGKPRKW